jgi:hypothetical protein
MISQLGKFTRERPFGDMYVDGRIILKRLRIWTSGKDFTNIVMSLVLSKKEGNLLTS